MRNLIYLLLLFSFTLAGQRSSTTYYRAATVTPVAPTFEPEYQAVLDYATTQGWTLPSDSMQTRGNLMVKSLKDSLEWDSLDVFYVFATDADSNFARINWKDPDTLLAQLSAGVNFMQMQGFKGTGGVPRITINYQPSLFLGNFKSSSAQFSTWLYDRGTSGSNYIFADFGRNLLRQDGLIRISAATNENATLPTSGFIGIGRSGSTTCHRNFNGTITDFTMNFASIDDNDIILLNRHGQNVGGDAIMSTWCAGGYVPGNAIYNIQNAYMSGL